MNKDTIRTYLRGVISGRKGWQVVFEALHHFSLVGLGYGNTPNCADVRPVIKYLSQCIDESIIPVVFDVGANRG